MAKRENVMNQSDFVNLIAEKGYTKRDAKQLVEDVVDTLEECLVHGMGVTLHGFGTFYPLRVEEKEMSNSFNGGRMIVPAHNCPKFAPSVKLREAMRDSVVQE